MWGYEGRDVWWRRTGRRTEVGVQVGFREGRGTTYLRTLDVRGVGLGVSDRNSLLRERWW